MIRTQITELCYLIKKWIMKNAFETSQAFVSSVCLVEYYGTNLQNVKQDFK